MSKDKKKMKAKKFEKEMEKLQGELVKMQQWVVASGAKVCILFEGRDTAGKGGVIKRITGTHQPACLPPCGLIRANRTRRNHRCISNGICPICRQPERSLSLTAVGTTGPVSSG